MSWLYLLRHAKAGWAAPGMRDFDRPLDDTGLADAEAMGRTMRAQRLVPDLTLDDGRRVAELLHEARPVMLDLDGGAAAEVARGWAHRVDIVSAGMVDRPAVAALIRPDGYIAWATDTFDSSNETNLRAALQRWCGPAGSIG